MIHDKIHPMSSGCPRPSIALQYRIVAWNTIYFIYTISTNCNLCFTTPDKQSEENARCLNNVLILLHHIDFFLLWTNNLCNQWRVLIALRDELISWEEKDLTVCEKWLVVKPFCLSQDEVCRAFSVRNDCLLRLRFVRWLFCSWSIIREWKIYSPNVWRGLCRHQFAKLFHHCFCKLCRRRFKLIYSFKNKFIHL